MNRFLPVMMLLIAPALASAQSHFTRINPAGPHAVGLQVVEQYDQSRGYRGATDPYSGQATLGERARPIQTLVWYPAENGSGDAMTPATTLHWAERPTNSLPRRRSGGRWQPASCAAGPATSAPIVPARNSRHR